MKNKKKWVSIILCLLCVLLLSTITEAKSKKVKYHTEVLELGDENEVWATVKFNYKLNTSGLSEKPISAIKTDNSKIATISKGILSAKKTGTTYISYNYKRSDGTAAIRKIKLRVINNKYVHSRYGDIYVDEYNYGPPEIEMVSIYYKKNQLCLQTAVVNNRTFRAKKFDHITWIVKINGKKVAKHKFKNIKLNIKPYGKKKVTFRFPFKKTIYDVGNQDIEWEYHYVYTGSY